MVNIDRHELARRVIVLETQILSQTNLKDRVVALEQSLSDANKIVQTSTITVTLLCKAVADLQKEVESLKNPPKKVDKTSKQKK